MAADHEGYVPFLWLASAWAAAANAPREMVLRRLCDWAMADGFPPGALITKAGEAVDLFEVFMAGRSEDATSRGILVGGITLCSRRWQNDILEDIIVSIQDVAAFCERVDTAPPPAMQGGWLPRFVERRRGRHRFPPPCPDAEARAIAYDASASAEASLNSLRRILEGAQGKPTMFFGRPADPAVKPVFEDWVSQWVRHRDQAQQTITRSGKAGHQQALTALDAEWAAFAQAKLTRSAAEAAGLPDSSTEAVDLTETKHAPRLRIKRGQKVVFLDGEQKPLSEQTLKLLCLLAESAQRGDGFIPNREIEACLWGSNLHKVSREVRDVMRELRDALAGKSDRSQQIRNLIETRKATGSRLALSAEDIEIGA